MKLVTNKEELFSAVMSGEDIYLLDVYELLHYDLIKDIKNAKFHKRISSIELVVSFKYKNDIIIDSYEDSSEIDYAVYDKMRIHTIYNHSLLFDAEYIKLYYHRIYKALLP